MRRELGVPRLGLGFRAWDRYALRSAAVRLNGLGFLPGRREQKPPTPQPVRERSGIRRSVLGPMTRAINSSRRTGARRLERSNSDSPDGCPMAEGPTSNSNRRTGPGTKGFINSVDPARAACGELGQIRSGSIPSWETLPESESSVRSYPGNRDRAPRFLWSETLVKPNNAVIVAAAELAGEVFRHLYGNFPKVFTQVDTRPATHATVPGSGPAWPTPGASAVGAPSAWRPGPSGAS